MCILFHMFIDTTEETKNIMPFQLSYKGGITAGWSLSVVILAFVGVPDLS